VHGIKVNVLIPSEGISKIVVALVTRAQVNAQGSRLKIAASLAEDGHISELLDDIWESPETPLVLLAQVELSS